MRQRVSINMVACRSWEPHVHTTVPFAGKSSSKVCAIITEVRTHSHGREYFVSLYQVQLSHFLLIHSSSLTHFLVFRPLFQQFSFIHGGWMPNISRTGLSNRFTILTINSRQNKSNEHPRSHVMYTVLRINSYSFLFFTHKVGIQTEQFYQSSSHNPKHTLTLLHT